MKTSFHTTKEEIPEKEKGTLAEHLRDHIGVFSSGDYVAGGAQLSDNTSKKFALSLFKKLFQKRR